MYVDTGKVPGSDLLHNINEENEFKVSDSKAGKL